MINELGIADIYLFILAGFLGFHLITRIPPLLHTPLMAATNAISGIAVIGSIVVAGENYDTVTNILAFFAVTFSTINVVGGFLITDRILKMFKKEKPKSDKS
jgi:NAD(P) transhydrogenase subunit alpha